MKFGLFAGAVALIIYTIVAMLMGAPLPPATEETASPASEPSSSRARATLPAPATTTAPRPSPPPALTPSPTPLPLPVALEQYVAGLDGIYGVAARRLEGGEPVLINADRRYPSASLYKLLVMYRVFQRMEAGDLSPGETLTIQPRDMQDAGSDEGLSPGDSITVERALEAMITVSSNAASFALVRAVGGWDYTMGAAQELGMSSTYLDDYAWSSPADMLGFLELLARRQLVNPSASDRMVDLMKRQQIDNRIPALLPESVEVAHKTGELGDVRNDAGIVFAGDGTYVVVFMSDEISPGQAVEAEARMSRMIYDRFAGS